MGVLGAIAGSKEDKVTTTRDVGSASELEELGGEITQEQLRSLRDLVGQGPSAFDVGQGVAAQRQFAGDIAALRDRGGLPTAQQRGQAAEFFQPQRVALEQTLEDEQRRVARLAGRLGRSQDDPVLQAKLAQTAARGEERIGAQQAQFAQQLPFQQLQLSQQLASVRQGLASQALQNRQTLLNLGSAVQSQGQQFRLGASKTEQTSGGGLKGAVAGGFAGAAATANIAGSFMGMPGGGGGGFAGGLGGSVPSGGSGLGGGGAQGFLGSPINQGSGFSNFV